MCVSGKLKKQSKSQFTPYRADWKWRPEYFRTLRTGRAGCDTYPLFVHNKQTCLEAIPLHCLYTRHKPAGNDTRLLYVHKTQTGSKLYPSSVCTQDTDRLEMIPVFCSYTRHRSARNYNRLQFVYKTQIGSKLYPSSVRTQDTDRLEMIPVFCS
jgi:hypothetical protein